ncbi:MAG: hypothetical protein QM713_09835 [Arachnia sp.]
MRSVWWRRNRLWLALLVPLALLAVAASSFRLVTLYLPWEWSRPVVAHGPAGTLRQSFDDLAGTRTTREVRVEVISIEAHETYAKTKAAVGGTLWRAVLEFEAAPDQQLYGCEVELTDAAGTRYDFRSGLEPATEGDYFQAPILLPCVPEDAPGPTVEPLTGTSVPSPVQRPRTWREQVLIAMPEGVTPTGVRIGWSRPEYLVLQIP